MKLKINCSKGIEMSFKASEIAREIKAELKGDDVEISGPSSIIWAADTRNFEKALNSTAGVIIASNKIKYTDIRGKTLLVAGDPKLAFAKVLGLFEVKTPLNGIHEKAVIDPEARLGKDVAVGPNAVINKGAVIGDNVQIHAGVYIGEGAEIGAGTVIYPNAVIFDRVFMGRSVIIYSGAVIGSEGFGYVKEGAKNFKIPQLGTVHIGDEAEIGSNTCVDRATTGATRIGRGTKIDNLVHIAHNVEIGEDCIIVAMTGVAGSSKVGDRVILAAQVGVSDHVKIGHDTMVLGRAGVTKEIKPKSMVSGFPAKSHREELKMQSYMTSLSKTIESFNKRIEELENKAK
ncbi:MAG: UDP-3-O-(3-hydroxymyristoyl)glucosamine N-acyltransferase [Armatimonadota bacterium]